ncbi:sulfotransferase family protein [Nisaea sediminum]|uniref:sulfotransferase family protein n=1 Tax=Nisaea sediminum TaxID=2775867 RepID=UPI001866230E|nr:sulfotransferase [Nisaea sediminum]
MPDPFDAVHARLLELPVFFVGGMPRSGTTWMQQLLNAHPNVLCMGESRFFEDLIPNLYEMLKSYSQRRHDLVDTWGPGVNGLVGMHMGPIFKASFASLAGANLGDKDVADLVTVGEKTPDNITSLRRLWQIYPEARVIHVIRDPRDGAVSGYIRFNTKLVRHISREDYIPSYCEQWRNRILEARKLAEGHAFMEVRYEDLHADAENTAAKLFRFLGAPDDAETVAAAVQKASFESLSGGRKRGETDARSHYRQGVVGGWRAELTETEQAAAIEAAEPVLSELGYLEPEDRAASGEA